jgi:hypothetical protein
MVAGDLRLELRLAEANTVIDDVEAVLKYRRIADGKLEHLGRVHDQLR